MNRSKKKRIGILRFLGTNCDQDVWQAVEAVGLTPEYLWYQDHFEPQSFSAFILPGGFSYGDYLRCGALAAKSQAMKSLGEGVKKGIPVLGICNGFQILCESQLLPGVLVRNKSRRFIDKWVDLELVSQRSAFTSGGVVPRPMKLPIAHGEGCFFIDPDGLKALQDKDQIWWTYKPDAHGSNPNGSVAHIAGVLNEEGNVAGLMPHPERACFDWMGGLDGRCFFEVLAN